MITRFDKALEQAARADSDLKTDRIALESHAQRIRRLEELIRAKEATGDRIVISIAAALVVSSMALPVYAAFYSDGYAYLPSIGNSLSSTTSNVVGHLQSIMPNASPASSIRVPEFDQMETGGTGTARRQRTQATFARYVIHRASEASALIEGPSGLWWVTPGMKIPGAGQILSIERSDAGWTVVTSETTITEGTGAGILR